MRVSNKQLLDSSILAMQQQATDALKYQRQIASGNRFAKASEGAVELAQGVALQFAEIPYEMFFSNQKIIELRATNAFYSLDSMSELFSRLKDIAAQATFAGIDATGLRALREEAAVLSNAILDMASAEDGNGDPFFLNDAAPLTELEIEPGVFLIEGLGYKEVMEENTDVSDDLDDFLAELDALIATGSPATTVSTTLDAAVDQVLAARTRAAALVSQIDAAKIASEAKRAAITAAQDGLLGTDLAEAATKLTRVQTLLEAARSVFSRLEASNLFQRLL